MKILIIQDQLRIGGTERQSLLLARTFNKKGHDTTLLVFRPGGHLADQGGEDDHLNIETLQSFDSKLSLWAPGLRRKIRQLDPDVILCMGRTANSYSGYLQLKFPDIPIVSTLRTGKMIFPLHYWSLRKVRAVLVNSNWWKRQLVRHSFPENRIHVVHNSLLLERSDKDRSHARIIQRKANGIDGDTCVFLNVATFRPGKRHRDLIRLFRRIKEEYPDLAWKLWLVGDGPEFRKCKHWVAENGLGTRIRFFHFQADPFPFYAAADVAVSVSREDSLPNFLIESQATGLPVVAYDCRGVAETCIPGKTGLIIEPGNQNEMVNALCSFMQSPQKIQAYAEHASDFARSRFSREVQADSILQFLVQVANSSA